MSIQQSTLLMPPIKAVLFDAGGTLLKTRSLALSFQEITAQYGYDFSLEQISSHMEEIDDLYETLYEEDDTFWTSVDQSELLWKRIYSYLARRVGVVGSDRKLVAHDMYIRYVTPSGWDLYDDVLPGIEALHQEGYQLGIISNWGAGLPEIMDELAVSPYMDFMIASSEVNMKKPDAGIFELAVDKLGLSAKEVVYVGDHRYADVFGSTNAGLQSIHILRDNREPGSGNPSSLKGEGVLEISTITEVASALQRAQSVAR